MDLVDTALLHVETMMCWSTRAVSSSSRVWVTCSQNIAKHGGEMLCWLWHTVSNPCTGKVFTVEAFGLK